MATSANGTSRAMAVRPVAFDVKSESKPGVTYRVQLAHCDCPDFDNRRGSARNPLCKHIRLAYQAAGWQIPGTFGLDEATAVELLVDFRVSASAAGAAVRRAREGLRQGTVGLPDGGIAVIIYRKGANLYDVELAG